MFLALALATLVALVVRIVAFADLGAALRILGVLGAAALAAGWIRAYRRRGFALWQDPVECLSLLGTGYAAGPDHAEGLFFCGLFLRALLVHTPRLAVSTAIYVAAYLLVGSGELALTLPTQTLPEAAPLALTAAGMHLFGRTLAQYEASMARERELAEEVERRAGEERFRSLVQAASDMILVIDVTGRVTFQSPSAERLLGVEPDELVGRTLVELVAPDGHGWLDDLAAVLDDGALGWRAQRSDGSWVELEAVVTDLRHDPLVEGFVLTSREVGERKAFERMLAHQAYHDSVTGLANRGGFVQRLRESLAAEAEALPAVLYLDLDDFKAVNDTLGHRAGDELLLLVGSRLAGCLREGDLAARLGGDEFALLVAGAREHETAARVAQRVIEALESPFAVDGREVRTGASVGIVCQHGDADELLRNADAALCAAKQAGKGRYEFFEPAMQAAALDRLALRADLERALERDELVLHFQPTVDLVTREVTGAEALVRWRHPEQGLVPPGVFIPLAEETGLIVPLGRWVLEEACREARRWHNRFPDAASVDVSVNVSARQLLDPGLVDDVKGALERSGVDPQALVLEITETVLAQNTELAVARLEALRALGVRVAIDDFGTGYSSLSYLQHFPLDVLKVDRSFVEGVDRGTQGSTFAQVIVELAKVLRLGTVAEGIEREEQARALCELGCSLGQGFHFSRPLEPQAFEALLEQRFRAAAAARDVFALAGPVASRA